jgi:hypothetical protein
MQESKAYEDTCTDEIKGNQGCRWLTWQEITFPAEAINFDFASSCGKANGDATTESSPNFKIGATKSFSLCRPRLQSQQSDNRKN